jgi:hypothetical protein
MRNFLTSITLALICATANADNKVAQIVVSEKVTIKAMTVCLEGYLFAVAIKEHARSYEGSAGITLVQVMRPGSSASRPPQPVLCGEKK